MRYFGIYIFSLLILSSCSSLSKGFVVRHKTKKINLTGINDSIKIGYETDSAVIYLGLTDIKQRTEQILNSGKFNPRWDYETINDFKKNLSILEDLENDVVLEHWQNQKDSVNIEEYGLAGFIDQWMLKDLIFDKKAEVWNKFKNKFESKIIFHHIRDRLGGEQYYFTFDNGKEFHRQIIALGE